MDHNHHIALGYQVIRSATEALKKLEIDLDRTAFTHALNILEQTKGRIICTGIGKCSFVARKLASTLSSTGTPSFFVHPAMSFHTHHPKK